MKMVLDARDKEITLNTYVRYVDTGTIGKVVELKTSSNIDWVRIDKTDLWYRANLVEILDEKDIKKSSFFDKENDIDVDDLKEKANSLEDMEMDSSVAEGGG